MSENLRIYLKASGEEPYSNTYSILLDGSDEWLSVADHADFDFNYNSAFSLSAWVKTDSTSAMGIIGKFGDAPAYTGYGMQIKSLAGKFREPYFYLVNHWSNNRTLCRANVSMSSDEWHHVVCTTNGNTLVSGMNIYINGSAATVVEYIAENLGTNTMLNDEPLALGVDGDDGGNYVDGNLDELSIWNKELTSAEVSDIYNSGVPDDLAEHSAASDLLGWWRMGDGTGDSSDSSDSEARIYDQSGNSHDATPKNTESGDIEEDVPE